MATLTWRNVDAPDFGRSLQGLRDSSNMLGNAAGIWNDQIRAFAEQDKNAADLLAAQQRQAMNAEALTQSQYVNARGRQTDAGMDAASPAIREYLSKVRSGDQAGASAIFANSPELQGLRPDALAALGNTGDGMVGKILGNVGAGLQNQGREFEQLKSQYGFGQQVQSDTDRQVLTGLANEMTGSVASPEAAMRYIESKRTSLSPTQFAALQAHGAKAYGLNYGAITSSSPSPTVAGISSIGSAGAGTKQGNPYDVVLGFGEFGTPSKPVSQMTLGEAIKFGKETLIPATRNNAQLGLSGNKGSSAVGAYQFTQSTLADYGPKVLGKDWESQPLNQANQEKLAEAIYNDRKNGNLKETWAGLTNSTPGAYKDVPWSTARKEIAQREVGMDIDGAPQAAVTPPDSAQIRDASRMIAAAAGGQRNAPLVSDLATAENSTATPAEVDGELAKAPGLSNWTSKERGDAILDIMQRTGTNIPAVAGAILRHSLESPSTERGSIANWLGFTDKWKINKELLKTNIDQFKGGATDRGVSTAANTADFQKKLAAADVDAQTKRAAVNALQTQFDNGRTGIKGDLDSAIQRADKANRLLDEMVRKANSDSTLKPDRAGQTAARQALDAPAPVPAPPAPVATTGPSFNQSMTEARNTARAVITNQDVSKAKALMDSPGFAMLLPAVKEQIMTIANRQG